MLQGILYGRPKTIVFASHSEDPDTEQVEKHRNIGFAPSGLLRRKLLAMTEQRVLNRY